MSHKLPDSFSSTSLGQALDQSEAIQDTVEQSAAELFVINAVLKQEVPSHVQTGEVAEALQKTDELESRIQSSAEELAQVNEALKQEIGERAKLERKLASTQAALQQVRSQDQSSPSAARQAQ
jgi:C4-dicarboxylate-specific signal transduction histidine kinase